MLRQLWHGCCCPLKHKFLICYCDFAVGKSCCSWCCIYLLLLGSRDNYHTDFKHLPRVWLQTFLTRNCICSCLCHSQGTFYNVRTVHSSYLWVLVSKCDFFTVGVLWLPTDDSPVHPTITTAAPWYDRSIKQNLLGAIKIWSTFLFCHYNSVSAYCASLVKWFSSSRLQNMWALLRIVSSGLSTNIFSQALWSVLWRIVLPGGRSRLQTDPWARL